MDRRAIREDIINPINEDLYNDVDIAPIIKKYSDGKQIEEQGKARQEIRSILYEMQKNGDITFTESDIANISSRLGGTFHRNSGLIRSTLKYEKEKENYNPSISIGGDMKGNINTDKIGGDIHQEFTETINIDSQKEAELKSYGVEQSQIDELKSIILTSQKDRTTFTAKAMKWLSSVSASVAARGFYNNIPAIIDFVGRLIH